ncbi:hypothetical protein NXV83_21795 [Bacteroides thetaiotaomicron]|nr:hypothetical protein [Bacteroides thetaiotaomicron]MCS2486502.1 hypothetical protein [Bacteroides thetaiotaomicron]MCS3079198.1 hypothetical protein [Bacteroides thetaiotaomicron]
MSVLLCCQALSLSLFAQQQKVDTAHIYSIPEIMVSDPYQTREVRSASPLQVFNKEELKVGSINSIFYFLHKAAEPFNCLEQDNLA